MKLNNRERAILKKLEINRGCEFTVNEIAEIVYKDKTRPKFWETSVRSQMRLLCLKTELLGGPIVVRSTQLGRSRVAKYKVI